MGTVALFSYSSPSDISGVTTWLMRFAAFLRQSGYEVDCLLHHIGRVDSPSPAANLLRQAGVVVEEKERPVYMEDATGSVLEFLRRRKPGVFVPQCLFEGFYAGRIAGKVGLPWVMTLHSDEEDYWKPVETVEPRDSRGSTVCVSKHIAEKLSLACAQEVFDVIPCGVPKAASVAGWSRDSFTIVYSGRVMEHQKRFSLVIASMIRACQLNARVHCRIIGGNADAAPYVDQVTGAGLGERIEFLGRLEPERVPDELLKAQAILLMSDFEGLPVALLEAMARGVVPVARNIPSGIPELVKDRKTGLLVGEDPESATRALCALADSEELWTNCSRQARSLVERDYEELVCFAKWNGLLQRRMLSAESAAKIRIPHRFRLPKPIVSKMNPEKRRPSAALRYYWKTRMALGAIRRRMLAAR
jgi:colanic acid/amylovoran biosynthesis glycosyltransferase